jgi:imidazolonepropionase-like amidohydrolase
MIRFAGPPLESGYERAGLLLVNGDPTQDIRLLMDANKNIDLIMKDGQIFRITLTP